jgi:hypothetical protein
MATNNASLKEKIRLKEYLMMMDSQELLNSAMK